MTIHYSYEYSDPDPHAQYDEINYKGFGGGATRSLKVWYKKLKDCLRVTQPGDSTTTWKYNELFPTIQWVDGDNKYNPRKVSSVELPDGRQYQFFYNVYGELGRVVLPVGGAFEYDYLGGLPTGPDSGALSGINIYRRVIERRVYADGTQLETRTTFERPADDGTSGEISVAVEQYNNIPALIGRSKHFYKGSPVESFSWSTTRETNYSKWQGGKEWNTESFDTDSTIKQRVTSNWVQRYGSSAPETPPNDPRIGDTTTKLMDTNQVSQQVFSYDQYNNKTQTDEYDFGIGTPGALVRKTQTTYLVSNLSVNYTTVNPNTTNPDPNATVHLRSLPLQTSVYDNASAEKARTTYEYDNYTQGLTNRANISGHASMLAQPTHTVSYLTRGNVTAQTAWELPSTPRTTRMQYDIAGNAVSVTDPKNNPPTLFDFSDRYGVPDNEAESNTVPVELSSGLQTYAFATLVTNTLGHTAYTQYDYYLGKPVNGKDANGMVAKGRYDDVLGRGTELVVAENDANLRRRTLFSYDDIARLITTQSDQTTYADGALKSQALYDGLGRTTETRQYETSTAYIASRHQFDGLGRVTRSYNPYRTTSDETYGWTDTTYDGLGRVTRVETFDRFGASTGAVMTAYAGNGTTVTDQAGKVRRSITDGLGRLIRVDEPDTNGNLGAVTAPVQPTSYVYDVLDDLAKVTQGGQTRFFMYDSLKRLIRASNPEQNTNASIALTDPLTGNSQWSMKYVYDANSNLTQKVDPRNITCNYVYDALNRVTSRSYIGDPSSTPGVTYSYDALAVLYSKGRLTQVSSSVSTLDYLEYDQLGRVKQTKQTSAGGDASGYTTKYGYNLASEMISETYPSGKEMRTSYDGAGRVAQVSRYIANVFDKTYASTFSYAAHGAAKSFQLGNSKWEHTNFNSRLQPLQIGFGTSATNSSILQLDYGYGATNANNGNVLTQTITIGATIMSQSYGYDGLNRLSSASEGPAWSQTYDCDRYGNRAVRVGSYIPQQQLTPQSTSPTDFSAFNQSNNRIALGGFGYDAAGNLTSDPTTAANAMVYDAENRQVSYTKAGVTTTYAYDGDGRRVKKLDSTGTIIFVYNVGGQLIAEYHSDPVPPPAGGGGTSYLTSDHLGSTRVVTKSEGTVKARYDYVPFGEELGGGVGQRTTAMGYSAADSTKQKFTQKERDNESGLDYFGARYYSSAQGRFMSTDPNPVTKENFVNPQRWNLYIYVNNNPLAAVDPNGGDGEGKGGDKVISVFLVLSKSDRNTDSRGGPGWESTKKLAERNGYKLEVYGSPDVAGKGAPAATGENFEKALNNSKIVLYVDHGVGPRDSAPFSPSFIKVGETGYAPGGSGPVGPGVFGPETLKLAKDRPEASASVIGNFSCNSVQNYDLFENTAGLVQTQVVVDSGSDGLTAVGTLEKAANAFVRTYVSPNGTVANAVISANKVIDERVQGNINEKDKVEVRLKVGNPPH